MRKRILILLILMIVCIKVRAEDTGLYANVPTITQKPLISRYDIALWSSIAAVHAVNYRLDEVCFSKPYSQCHEGVLPGFIWKHPPVLAATHASFAVAQIVVSTELKKHGHQKLARTWDYTNLAAFTAIDAYVFHLTRGSLQYNVSPNIGLTKQIGEF